MTYDDGGAIWSKRGDLCVGPFEPILRSERGKVRRQSPTSDLLTHVHHNSYVVSRGRSSPSSTYEASVAIEAEPREHASS